MAFQMMVFTFLDSRHVAVSPQTCETTDKFRVHMFEEGNTEVNYYTFTMCLVFIETASVAW